jgi:hypothetical protein
MKRDRSTIPEVASKPARTRAKEFLGTTSPYPVVVNV